MEMSMNGNTYKIEPGADLRGAYLEGAYLGGADLKGANLKGANLKWANLEWADLSRADLSGANLKWANLERAGLSRADLSGADLGGAGLGGANLERASLGGANLSGADLGGANLERAYLGGADLSGADLSGADLKGTDLGGTDLREADLSGATGLLDAIDWLAANTERDSDGRGIIAYKTFAAVHSSPASWIIAPNSIISEVVNPCPTISCACGINVGTLAWIYQHKSDITPIWRVLIRWEWLASVVVPYNTHGQIRCGRVELLDIVEN